MKRFQNKAARYYAYLYLVKRDNPADECGKCAKCNVTDNDRELVIDHIDGNPYNWREDNLRLLCRSCNVPWKKTTEPPAIIKSECVNAKDAGEVERVGLSQSSVEIQINLDKEPKFRSAVQFYVFTKRQAGYTDVVYRFAEEIGISPVTADRYLKKMTSDAGPLKIVRTGKGSSKGLQIRPEYWKREQAAADVTTLQSCETEQVMESKK